MELKKSGQFRGWELNAVVKRTSDDFLDKLIVNDVEDVLRMPTPEIGTIAKYLGKNETKEMIAIQLYEGFKLWNADKIPNDLMIGMIALQMITDWPGASLGDIQLMVKYGCLGKFGKIYSEITPDLFLMKKDSQGNVGWVDQYLSSVGAEKAAIRQRKRDEVELLDKVNANYLVGAEKMAALDKAFSSIKDKKKEPKFTFKNTEHYLQINPQEAEKLDDLRDQWRIDYDMTNKSLSKEAYVIFREAVFINEINKK